tara:strand:- start:8806 stop:9060 length:255 start_codon:yes stop_codon:yes gene_type:complete
MRDEGQKNLEKNIEKIKSIEKEIENVIIRLDNLEKNIDKTNHKNKEIEPKKYELELDNKSKYQIGFLSAVIIILLIIYWLYRIF